MKARSFEPMYMWIRLVDLKVLVSSHSKVQMMHATPSKRSTVTIGKGALSRFAKIAMPTLVEVGAWVVVAVLLAVALAEECEEALPAVVASAAEVLMEEDTEVGEVATVVEGVLVTVVHLLELVTTAAELQRNLLLLTPSLTSRRRVVREVQQSSSATCHGLPATKTLSSSSRQLAKLSEQKSSMNPTADRADPVLSNSTQPTMRKRRSPSSPAINMAVVLLV